MNAADTVFTGGVVHTFDPDRPRAEALAVAGGRIVAVGDRREIETLAGPSTRRIALDGAAVLPGFNDAHVHVWKVGQLRTTLLDLRDTPSLDELYREVTRRARRAGPGEWILGRGWNEAQLDERDGPTRQGLDRAAPPSCSRARVRTSTRPTAPRWPRRGSGRRPKRRPEV
jgi:predicted amidohydrolase YtcJ